MPMTTKTLTDNKRRKAAPRKAEVAVEFPREGESVSSPGYTIRVAAAKGTTRAEVSIDGGPWRACREALGLWWFDWEGYAPGERKISARAWRSDGEMDFSAPRRCLVEPPQGI